MKCVPVVNIVNNLQPQLTAATTSCSLNKFMLVVTTTTYLITTVSYTHIFLQFCVRSFHQFTDVTYNCKNEL
jgi:hypothetical protein